jgi:hypothetical protein
VASLALMIAYGVNCAGNREILAIEPMLDESEESLAGVLQETQEPGDEALSALHLGRAPGQPGRGAEGMGGGRAGSAVRFIL